MTLSSFAPWTVRLFQLIVLWAFLVQPAVAQQSQDAFIRGLYREYYERTPNRAELEEWLGWFRRGVSAEEIHASFIGSEEFFNKYNRDVRRWADAVFLTVNNRRARVDELDYWSQRLAALGNDRRRWGIEFLKTYGSNVAPNPGNPGARPPNLGNLPDLVLTSAQSLSQSIDYEFSGLQYRLLKIQANNLVSIASSGRQAFQNAERNPTAAQNAVRDLQVAIDAMNQTLANSNGARNSRFYAAQLEQHVRRLANALPAGGNSANRPTFPSRPNGSDISRPQFARLTREIETLNGEASQFNYLVTTLAMFDYQLRQLASDAEGFANQVDQVRRNLNQNTSLAPFRSNVQQLRRTARRIDRDLSNRPTDIRISQGWHEIVQSVNSLSREVGLAGDGFNGGQNGNGGDRGQRTRIIQALDRAITACDSLDQALLPYRLSGRGVAMFLTDLRELRGRLAAERQHVVDREDVAQIQFDVQNLRVVINRLNAGWSNVQAITGNGYVPLYRTLATAMDQVYESVR